MYHMKNNVKVIEQTDQYWFNVMGCFIYTHYGHTVLGDHNTCVHPLYTVYDYLIWKAFLRIHIQPQSSKQFKSTQRKNTRMLLYL